MFYNLFFTATKESFKFFIFRKIEISHDLDADKINASISRSGKKTNSFRKKAIFLKRMKLYGYYTIFKISLSPMKTLFH